MSAPTSADTSARFSAFDRTTSIWGPITLSLGLLFSLAAALYAAFGTGVGVTPLELVTAVGAVLATFGIIAVIEPVSYFPILGRSAMYQAFLIGNIANKLLPAAIVAQANLGEKPGTRRAELIAGSAIIGAVLVHITTLDPARGRAGNVARGNAPRAAHRHGPELHPARDFRRRGAAKRHGHEEPPYHRRGGHRCRGHRVRGGAAGSGTDVLCHRAGRHHHHRGLLVCAVQDSASPAQADPAVAGQAARISEPTH